MLGLMQNWPLTVDKILDHAATFHKSQAVVSLGADGTVQRTNYGDIRNRAKRVSAALLHLGIRPGDRVGIMGWNSARHLEAWYGISGIGAICHTINPRLFTDQLAYIVNHAADRILFADASLAKIIHACLPRWPGIERIIWMADPEESPAMPEPAPGAAFRSALDYEALIAAHPPEAAWGGFDENSACGLCYTSGTTGDPKGVLYSHRSNFIHTLATLQRDAMGCSARDTVLMIVPMFHANGWGLAYSGPAVGARLILPGPRLDGASVHKLLESERVTFSAAVPTVLQGLLQHLDATGGSLTTLKRIVVGGAACPGSLIEAFEQRYGVEMVHLWGMTELSPMGTADAISAEIDALPYAQKLSYKLKQGRAPICVEMKITDDHGAPLPWDGESDGILSVRGPFVAAAYFGKEKTSILDEDGYFDTGDIASIDPEGRMQITDRSKDVIKSGGEWISSVAVENAALSHPKAALAAVIAVPHPRWTERPLLLMQLKPGEEAEKQEILAFLKGKIASWQVPDDVVFVDNIPLGPTGKVDKKALRDQWRDHKLPNTERS